MFGRNAAVRQEPRPPIPLQSVQHIDEKRRAQALQDIRDMDAELVELRARCARQQAQIAELERAEDFLREQLQQQEIRVHAFHKRAVAAEKALRVASKVIIDAAEEGEREAAAMGEQPQEQPRGKEGATDLDTQRVGMRFGANNRDDADEASDQTEASRG